MSKPKSKIFANGSTTLPKPVREALGVEAGDTVCYIISENGVQVLRALNVSEVAGMLAREGEAAVSLGEMQDAISRGAIESGK